MTWLVVSLLLSGPARAQEDGSAADLDARARELYDNGAILYDEGRYEDAIVAWEEAYRLSGRPLLLYNIANAQERLGQWRAALDTLNRYRAYARPEERERLDRRIANLERRLSEEPAATAAVAPAFATSPSDTIAPPPEEPRDRRWLPAVSYGVGGAGLAAGTVFALRASAAREEAAGLCQATGDLTLCPAAADDPLRRDAVSSWIADGSFALGAIGLAGGVVLTVAGRDVTSVGGGLTVTPTGLLWQAPF